VVIKPGQRLFLERFLDSNNKFEFSTYEVKNTSENRSAIDLNGDVIIEFYDESQIVNYPHLSGGNWGSGWTTINTGTPYYYGNMFTTTSSSLSGNLITGGLNNTVTSSVNLSKYSSKEPKPERTLKSKKSIETGRVEKGEESNQSFVNSYQNFVPHTCNRVQFKIVPLSTKNKNVEEIRQYCTECGTKVKKNYKFCPSCGNKI
jgi:hypothetical protein